MENSAEAAQSRSDEAEPPQGRLAFDGHDDGRTDDQRSSDNRERQARSSVVETFAELFERQNIDLHVKFAAPGGTEQLAKVLRQPGDEGERSAQARQPPNQGIGRSVVK